MPVSTAWIDADYEAVANALVAFTDAHPEITLVAPRQRLSKPPEFTGDPEAPARLAAWEIRYEDVRPGTFGEDAPMRDGSILLSAWIEPHRGGAGEAARELLRWLLAPFEGIAKVGSLNLLEPAPTDPKQVAGWHVETIQLSFLGA